MIKPKKGKCVDCHDDKPEQWLAKNKPPLCRWHNEKRKAEVKKSKGKSPYKYIKKATGERELFEEILEDRGARSEISDEPIYNIGPINFIHLLAKGQGRYPLFKLNKDNIVIGTAEEHHEFDHGSQSKLREDPRWDWVFEKIEKLKREYKELEKKLKI